MSDQNATTELAEGEERYVVRLMWGVPATSHKEAVKKILDQLARFGIIDWVYRAEAPDGSTAYINGDLETIDMQAIADQLDAEAEEALAFQQDQERDGRPIEDVELPAEEE